MSSWNASWIHVCVGCYSLPIGFAFMFSEGNGWIGYHYFSCRTLPRLTGTTGMPFSPFGSFQFAFADTCSTITSGR